MCGLVGIASHDPNLGEDRLKSYAFEMAEAIKHRGPDAYGIWARDGCFALAFRRLSIIDLSSAANQPMRSGCGRWILAFNGECYNFRALRDELNRSTTIAWKTQSDTEVFLEAIAFWGIEDSLKKVNGMFAIAAYDQAESRLYFAVDRLGKKPLYYAMIANRLIFGSELKALVACDFFPRIVDIDALAKYLQFGYVPSRYCIFEHTKKVEPATYVSIDLTPANNFRTLAEKKYWVCPTSVRTSQERPPLDQKLAELESTLEDAVAKRLVSDVPIGCLLSGGIDSSLIAALAVSTNPTGQAIKTFSVGFEESGFDESRYARQIAAHLGTEHTELTLTHKLTMSAVDHMPQIYDEPFSDPSQIPTYLIAKLARQFVTVVLTGDGGDEGFLGYSRYRRKFGQWQKAKLLPATLRRLTSTCFRATSSRIDRLTGSSGILSRYTDSLQRLGSLIGSRNSSDAYFHGIAIWHDPNRLIAPISQFISKPAEFDQFGEDDIRNFSFIDLHTYLPGDVLCKVDRATMAASLEARSPLLDYRIIELSRTFSASQLHVNGVGKQPLRHVLGKHVPTSLFDRPKMGFGIPVTTWLRGPLHDWASGTLLDSDCLTDMLVKSEVEKLWNGFNRGADGLTSIVWAILCLKMWAAEYRI